MPWISGDDGSHRQHMFELPPDEGGGLKGSLKYAGIIMLIAIVLGLVVFIAIIGVNAWLK